MGTANSSQSHRSRIGSILLALPAKSSNHPLHIRCLSPLHPITPRYDRLLGAGPELSFDYETACRRLHVRLVYPCIVHARRVLGAESALRVRRFKETGVRRRFLIETTGTQAGNTFKERQEGVKRPRAAAAPTIAFKCRLYPLINQRAATIT